LQVASSRLLVLLFLLDLLFTDLLLGFPGNIGAFVAPWFLFFLPGGAVLSLRKEFGAVSSFIAGSIVAGILINFAARTLMWSLSAVASSTVMIAAFSSGAGALLLIELAREYRSHARTPIRLERKDLYLVLLMCGAYVAVSAFVLATRYTPGPDELHYSLYARLLNLEGSFPLSAPNKAFVFNFVGSRPLWIFTLATYLEVSSATAQAATMIGSFFLITIMVATYKAAEFLFGKTVALTSAVLVALSPSLLMWSSDMLTDVPLASFIILGYGFYLTSLRTAEGRLIGLRTLPFVMTLACFSCAVLTKLTNPVFFIPIYLHLGYSVWRSRLAFRTWLLPILVALPLAYLGVDAVFNYFTYIVPNAVISSELLPYIPVSFLERFIISSATSPAAVIEGLYFAILSPFTITYPIVFLFLGGATYLYAEKGPARTHFTLGVSIILVTSLVSSILLAQSLILREDLFLIPIILTFAAVAVNKHLGGGFLIVLGLSAFALAFIHWVELQQLARGITLGILPGPSQYSSSIYSLNFLLGLGIIAWMAFDYVRVRAGPKRLPRVLSFPGTGWPVALGLVVLVSVSQFAYFAAASPYRSRSDFQELDAWLGHNIHPGDVIATNYPPTLLSQLNASALRLAYNSGIRVLQTPDNPAEFIYMVQSLSYRYVILFTQAQYAGGAAQTGDLDVAEQMWTDTILDTPVATISVPSPSGPISSSTFNGGDKSSAFAANLTTSNLHVNFSYYARNLGAGPYEPMYLTFADNTSLFLSFNPLPNGTPDPGDAYVSIPRVQGKWVNATVDIGSAVESAFGQGVVKQVSFVVFRLQDGSPATLKIRGVVLYATGQAQGGTP